MSILCAGATDIGRKRKTNQDSILIDPDHLFFAVADGMGGHNGGDIASQMSISMMSESIKKNSHLPAEELMKTSLEEINQAIYKRAAEQSELKGMGTTFSAIQFQGPQLVIANVGDSRVYMLHHQNIYQLTRDHSFIQEKINLGIYSREDALRDPQKNILIRSVGFEESLQVDIFFYRICKNDIFLICSDGLHGKVSDEEILHTIIKNIPDPSRSDSAVLEQTVQELIHIANFKGGQDNISVILALAQASS